MAFNLNFHFFSNKFSCNSEEPLLQKSKRQPEKQMTKKKKPKYMDKTLTKMERNRLCMEIYCQERCNEKQKQKMREYDRKRAAATRLKKKIEQESNRERNIEIQMKFQLPLRNLKNLSTRFVMLKKILPGK